MDQNQDPTLPETVAATPKVEKTKAEFDQVVNGHMLQHASVDALASILSFMSKPAEISVFIKEKLEVLDVEDGDITYLKDYISSSPGICVIRPELGDVVESTDTITMKTGRFGNLFFFVDDIESIEWVGNEYHITFKTGAHRHKVKLLVETFLGVNYNDDAQVFDFMFSVAPDHLSVVIPGLLYLFRAEWIKPIRPIQDIVTEA